MSGVASINLVGNGLNNILTGNEAVNILLGGLGNDSLNGRGGADDMQGGGGDDTYVVDNTADSVTEGAGSGTDLVRTAVSYTLPDNVENGELLGVAGILLTGNELANVLVGNGGANTLNGRGGADDMQGGGGNDDYVVDNVGDSITESTGGGTDLVRTAVSYTLSDNVENGELLGVTSINLVGNGLNNILTGNAAANILLGGLGNDSLNGRGGADDMQGGGGDDTYVVDNTADSVTEGAESGTDLVRTAVSYTLSDNVENGELLGVASINLVGNGLNNILTGNEAVNILLGGLGNDNLDGRGGADDMQGGGGDDTYVVDDAGDLVGEIADSGIDTVLSAVSRGVLGANVERLTLTGNDNINGSGNDLANVLLGNSGNNVIDGREGNDTILAGLGLDTQYGGTGSDTFVFNSAAESGPSSLERDRIADFTLGDLIYLAAIDADEITDGNQAFALDTDGSFSAGEIKQTQFGANLLLEMNTDADAAAEMSILLLNSGPLDAGDFVL